MDEMVPLNAPRAHPAPHLDLLGLLPPDLEALVAAMGEAPYRARQLQSWLYARAARDIGSMTDLSTSFRRELAGRACIGRPALEACREDQGGEAAKFLFRLPDGERVESVLIYDGARRTACLSSQVGCGLGCTFCATARMGFRRHLTAGEIIGQLLEIGVVLRQRRERVTNVVLMGMGEPLLNLDAVLRSIQVMRLVPGPGIGGRRITVSTAGHVPGIHLLARARLNVGLAISLNATTDELRRQLMPIARQYSIADLLGAAQDYFDVVGRRVTFEYVLMAGVNDSLEDARRLGTLSRRVPCKLNLIPYNESGDDTPYRRPAAHWIQRFRAAVAAVSPVQTTVRDSHGRGIAAACGQLYQQHRSPRR